MIRALLVLLAVATPAAAQVAPLSFEAGKSLQMAAGEWSHTETATGSEARYGTHLSLLCDRATRTIAVTRPSVPIATLTIATDTLTRTLPPNGRLPAYDPLFDAIAFSRGRFLVSSGTGPVLAIPSWPEVTRVVEDCRS